MISDAFSLVRWQISRVMHVDGLRSNLPGPWADCSSVSLLSRYLCSVSHGLICWGSYTVGMGNYSRSGLVQHPCERSLPAGGRVGAGFSLIGGPMR
jgi:hypothetical protein